MSLPSENKRKIFDGRYEILSIVGRGADSVVYHARHITGTAQEVAIKVLINRSGGLGLADKLRKEALTLVSCRHKYVVRLDDFHSIKDLCYLAMEYAPKGDLTKYVQNFVNKLPIDQATLFLRQSLEALDFIHATGVIHRDIKPENILVVNDKEIRLADFGLALLPGDEVALEELRAGVGTFDYLAPEALEGVRYDALSDLYSLGLCFYEAISGSHPFRNVPLAKQQEIRKDEQIRPLHDLAPEVPAHVAAVISTLMKFSPANRFQSASEALQALSEPDFRQTSKIPLPAKSDQPQAITAQPSSATATRIAHHEDESIVAAPRGNAEAVPVVEPSPSSSKQPANSDQVAERSPQPTEKIDLERVKAIIARDSNRRSSSSAALSGSTGTGSHNGSSRASQSKISISSTHLTRSRASGVKPGFLPLLGTFRELPTVVKSVAVAIFSAIITVTAAIAWHAVYPSEQAAKQTIASESQHSDAEERKQPSGETVIQADRAHPGTILSIPQGFHTGRIRGLFPAGDTPLAFISQGGSQGTVLIVGLEGWVPTLANSNNEEPEGKSSTFRSNGLILKFDRELSSDKITGTVTDVVTGESGTWIVEKTS